MKMILWKYSKKTLKRNFVLQNPVTRQDSLGKFLYNTLLFTLCLGTIFPQKTKLLSYYNRDKKEGS